MYEWLIWYRNICYIIASIIILRGTQVMASGLWVIGLNTDMDTNKNMRECDGLFCKMHSIFLLLEANSPWSINMWSVLRSDACDANHVSPFSINTQSHSLIASWVASCIITLISSHPPCEECFEWTLTSFWALVCRVAWHHRGQCLLLYWVPQSLSGHGARHSVRDVSDKWCYNDSDDDVSK